MANPFIAGTEKAKLYDYAVARGNPDLGADSGAARFADTHAGRGYFDVSGATAVPLTNLPKQSLAVRRSVATR
jgi:hypothetical protein